MTKKINVYQGTFCSLDMKKYLFSAILLSLSILGTYNSVFVLFLLIISFFSILFLKFDDMLAILFFLLPFASIMKISPGAQSIFTYICLFFVILNVTKQKDLGRNFFFVFLLLFIYLLTSSFTAFNVSRIVKFLVNLILIYFSFSLCKIRQYFTVFGFFIAGVIISSFTALSEIIPNLSLYIREVDLWTPNTSLERFTGLYGDPNYYSVNVIISLCLIVLFYHTGRIKGLYASILAVLLVWFVALTYSKSSFVMLTLPIVLYLYSLICRRKWRILICSLIVLIAIASFVFSGQISAFHMVLDRFNKSDDLSSLTTGRVDLWLKYIFYLLNEGDLLLWGNGFGATLPFDHAPHNTYIDLLFYLGIVGCFLFVLLFVFALRKKSGGRKICFLNYSVWICIVTMYFFLSELFYIDLAFHLILAVFVQRIDFRKPKYIYNLM